MPNRRRRPGYIIIVCGVCGNPLRIQAYGGNKKRHPLLEKEKYNGVPITGSVLEEYGYRCPYCGARLEPEPLEVKILPLKKVDIEEYERKYVGMRTGVEAHDEEKGEVHHNGLGEQGSDNSVRDPHWRHSVQGAEDGAVQV